MARPWSAHPASVGRHVSRDAPLLLQVLLETTSNAVVIKAALHRRVGNPHACRRGSPTPRHRRRNELAMSQIPSPTLTQVEGHVYYLRWVNTSIRRCSCIIIIFICGIHMYTQISHSLRLFLAILWRPRAILLRRVAVARRPNVRVTTQRAASGRRSPAVGPARPIVRRGALALVPASRTLPLLVSANFPRVAARARSRERGIQQETPRLPGQAAPPVALVGQIGAQQPLRSCAVVGAGVGGVGGSLAALQQSPPLCGAGLDMVVVLGVVGGVQGCGRGLRGLR